MLYVITQLSSQSLSIPRGEIHPTMVAREGGGQPRSHYRLARWPNLLPPPLPPLQPPFLPVLPRLPRLPPLLSLAAQLTRLERRPPSRSIDNGSGRASVASRHGGLLCLVRPKSAQCIVCRVSASCDTIDTLVK